jgi:hypothetical protein
MLHGAGIFTIIGLFVGYLPWCWLFVGDFVRANVGKSSSTMENIG